MHQCAKLRAAVAAGTTIVMIALDGGCGPTATHNPAQPDANRDATTSHVDGATTGSDATINPPPPSSFTVSLVPDGVTGTQRVNFAVPLAAGQLTDPSTIQMLVAA